ncbi:cupin domain-containing protein [Rhodococcus opacus]|uniref:cupin domain-containing protein n=1 Tax=Rhodococcus opacus TaxID=37919 RepID=UPI001FF1C14F|nr:cupin domain-containing protein [Rhodococcus opacus]UOT05755.1 cupin domain-containing protein [Rhodococcus opacus]
MSLPRPDPNDPRHNTRGGGIHVPANAGLQRWFAGDAYSIKLTAADTNGTVGIVQGTVPPGGGPIPHVHTTQEETFYVLSGELEFLEGERTFMAQTGDLVHIPRGVRHRFHNVGYHAAQLLFVYTPGGTEGMFVDGGEEPRPGVQVEAWGPERFQTEAMKDLYVEYNVEIQP